jgi:hypothetical protein
VVAAKAGGGDLAAGGRSMAELAEAVLGLTDLKKAGGAQGCFRGPPTSVSPPHRRSLPHHGAASCGRCAGLLPWATHLRVSATSPFIAAWCSVMSTHVPHGAASCRLTCRHPSRLTLLRSPNPTQTSVEVESMAQGEGLRSRHLEGRPKRSSKIGS